LFLETWQTPKATIDVKELRLDISKDGGSKPNLYVKLNISPVLIHMGESRIISDQMPNFNNGGCISSGEVAFGNMDRSSAAFFCEELSLSCEFNHDRYFSLDMFFSFNCSCQKSDHNCSINQ